MGQRRPGKAFAELFTTFTQEEHVQMLDLTTKVEATLANVRANVESFNVLHDTAEKAAQARDAARVSLFRTLDDAVHGLTTLRDNLGVTQADLDAHPLSAPAPATTA